MLIPGGVNQHSTWKGSVKDFGRIASDNADPGRWGLIDTQLGQDPQRLLEGLPLTMVILGIRAVHSTSETPDPPGLDRQDQLGQGSATWKGSAKTLEGLPLTMLILEGVGGQLMANLERIHKHFGCITSDNVDPGGVNRWST